MGDWLYVGSCAGVFYAFDRVTGDIRWEYDVAGDGAMQFHGNPLVLDTMIVFGTDMGTQQQIGSLYALNRLSGKLLWKLAADPGLPSDIVREGDRVFTSSHADELLAVNLSSGDIAWRFKTKWQYDPTLLYEKMLEIPRLTSTPLIVDGAVYYAGRDSTVICLGAESGTVRWTRHLPAAISTQLRYADSTIVCGMSNYGLIYLNPNNGQTMASHALDVVAQETMSYENGTLMFLAGYEDRRLWDLVAIDKDGLLKWDGRADREDVDAYWYVPRVHVWEGNAIVGSTKGRLIAFDIDDGSIQWELRLDGMIRGIGHSEDMLYVGTFEGILYALKKR